MPWFYGKTCKRYFTIFVADDFKNRINEQSEPGRDRNWHIGD